jgi:ribosome recycling factor
MPNTEVDIFKSDSKKALFFLTEEFKSLQIGMANPSLVENILISSYGTTSPLKNLSNITVESSQSLLITPWDKSLITTIEKAIRDDSSLGLSPINDGAGVRLNIPPLTKERRLHLVKVAKEKGEQAKITIRKYRHEAMDSIKNGELSEDLSKLSEKSLQKEVDLINKEVETMVKNKCNTILKV